MHLIRLQCSKQWNLMIFLYSLRFPNNSKSHIFFKFLFDRRSRLEVFCRNGVLRNLGPTTLLKKRLWHRCFPVNFVKFPRTPFFTEHLRTTASESSKQYAFYWALTIVDLPKLSRRFHPSDIHEIFD